MRRIALALAMLLGAPVLAQQGPAPDGVPERRVAISRDVDFYGSDLATILDSTLDACQAACVADQACVAFTYNTRNASCFPKGAVGEATPFAGGISGRILDTDPAVLADAPARAARLATLQPFDFEEAEALGLSIGREHSSDELTVDGLVAAAAEREGAGDPLTALMWTGAAVALSDDPALWSAYARLALALPEGSPEADAARARARPAALSAYLRAPDAAQQARALLLLAQALEGSARGRDSVSVLRVAADLAPSPEADAALERAVDLYGFAAGETQVDSEAAEPRACVLFNEPLRAGLDYAPFVRLPDESLTVTAQDAQLCVEGLRHGQRLSLTLREGLPAASGETLIRDVPLDLYVRDRRPAARVLSRAYVLPRGGDATIPVGSVNASEVAITLARVNDANLLRSLAEGAFDAPQWSWDRERFETDLGTVIWEGTVAVTQGAPNADVVTEVPMGEVLASEPTGVYVLTAAIPGESLDDRPATSQWFVLSDLGLATFQGTDGITVAVRALGNAAAVEGATVRLVSRANGTLGTAVTDAEGVATFEPGLARGLGGEAPALVTVATGSPDAPADMAFLSLLDPAFDLSDRGVEGREAPGPVDAYLALDRGAFRAGETVHATALLRDGGARAVSLPLWAILTRPDGVEAARVQSARDAAGGHVFALPISEAAPRGTWRLAVTVDPEGPPLAETPFLVEDFVPERVDVTLDAGAEEARVGEALPVAVEARWLFGAPAADLSLEGEVTLAPPAEVPGWEGWRFGLHDAVLQPLTESFSGTLTDADGLASLLAPLPSPEAAPGEPLEARVVVRAVEASGRPVERSLTVPVALDAPVIGLRVPDDAVSENTTATVSLVALGEGLAPVPMEVRWTVNRVETDYQWYELDGAWSWEPRTRRVRVAEGDLSLGAEPGTIAVPVEWGRYEVVAEGGNGAAVASATFDAGWYAPAQAEEAPDRLAVSLDAPAYRPGDTARLRIAAEGPGTALVTVLTSRVVAMEVVAMGEGETLVELPVTEEWGTGAYVAAHLLRPLEGRAPGQGHDPARSLGIAHAGVEPGDRRLSVSLDAPAEARPRGPLTVGLNVAGIAPGEEAFVTLAAVDVGILNLTAFESPDPAAHFLGQRRLGVELRDLYGRLILPAGGETGTLREGGDAMSLTTQSPPPTEALLAFFQGPVPVDANGRAAVTLDLPAFNGTVRLMAMAWSPRAVGAAEAEVLVRDPAVLTASLPRTLSPGDASRLRLDLTHAEGPAGEFGVQVAAPGLSVPAAPLAATLEPLGTWRRDLPISAGAAGTEAVSVTVTTPEGEALERTFILPVTAKDPEVVRTARFTLNPGEAFTFDDAVLAGFVPGSAEAALSVGPLARLDAAGLLTQLDRVPWGCTEQVTSQALPLLYLSDVAEALELAPRADLDARIADAVAAVLANQAPEGGFGLWGPYGGDLWLDAYVTDFLARARARGVEVPEVQWRMAMGNLSNQVALAPGFEPDVNGGGEGLAYALLVLAREGEALVGDLRYFADTRAEEFGTPLAIAQLGAALAQTGDQPRADRLFALAWDRLQATGEDPLQSVWRADYGTRRRDAAAVLTLAVEAGSRAVDRAQLTAEVASRVEAPASTQEAAWTLLAAAALAGDVREAGVTVDGVAPEGPIVRRVDGSGEAPLRVANDGAGPVELTVTAIGVPEVPEPAGGTGYGIDRAFYTMEGEPADPASVAVGTRLVAVVTVTPRGTQAGRLMVTDPLPGGWEIDNPSFLQGGNVEALSWLQPVAAANTEARLDRFLAAVDWQSDQPFQVAYVVRAVSPGTFHHAAPSVEDMYRPALRAQGEAGRVTVTE